MDGPIVLVLGADRDRPPPGIEAAAGHVELRYAPDLDRASQAIGDADAVFEWIHDPAVLPAVWGSAARLRWIQTVSDGVDSMLFPALIESDVVVTNARGVYEEPIAEWVIGAMLAFTTGMHRSILDQQRREWTTGRTVERLAGARLVIVGPGPIGRATAWRARALGMSVTVVGRRARVDASLGDVVGVDRLHDELARADHVLDALPLTEETRRLFDWRAFASMPRPARFYNVGRGDTVDEPALVDALRTGSISGAALDVVATEPLPVESPLWTMPNVIVSPHISGDAEGWEHRAVAVFVDNARRFATGEPLVNQVDKRAGFVTDEPVAQGRSMP
ncbi:MAG TPA: D-2-hydroxyacid dehydrogenase [Candidatus Limnocylindrales bacterium]|nr:D-2-hydroxyacid dehydrogenase [Candidatus Limnocylindrales bacterium]